MNNHTKSVPPLPGLSISMGYFASILCLLFILLLILLTLFLLFTKHQDNSVFDEHDLSDDMSTNANERKSFPTQQSKQYLSTIDSQQYPSINSFQMDIHEQNTRSTIDLLSSK
jgi:hypothetical protein